MLTIRNLWSGQPAKWWTDEWLKLTNYLIDIDPNYSVWTDWYNRRIRGERAAFDIPGDKNRKEDKLILRRLVEATDHDFWGKGHEFVNAELTRWLYEARARAASQVQPEPSALPQDPEQIAAALLRQASPQAQITNGKLDAGPNTVFDQPQYSDNLAELPSELLAFTGVILNSLPRNCEAVVRHCFAAFRDELMARGNRPIVNVLKAMAASLIAELYGAEQSEFAPDLRELKDPREWGDGMAAMFAQFFRGYHDLIHHFPLDPEREALIAATPIDEAAASGAALTEPVDAVAALILELGKQGFATDNIVRIIEAHQLYNRDVSQLPTPGQASQTVTPKRRHVLSTAGFYLHTYSVLGSTASIYALQTVPAVQALMLQLERAANALLAFVR